MACASACRMKTERNNASFLINEQSNLCVAVQIKIGRRDATVLEYPSLASIV